MALGIDNETRIYLVRKTKPQPTSIDDFTDISKYVTRLDVDMTLSSLKSLTADIVGSANTTSPTGSGTLYTDLSEGNFIYVMAGQKLVVKAMIVSADFAKEGQITVDALQSSGLNQGETLESTDWNGGDFGTSTLQKVLWQSDSGLDRGILINDASDPIVYKTSDSDSGTDLIEYSNEGDRISCLDEAMDAANKEWEIMHGYNDDTSPYSDGDHIRYKDALGSYSSSVYDLYLSGDSTNCIPEKNNSKDEQVVNSVIVHGYDFSSKLITSKISNCTDSNRSEVQTQLDTTLKTEIGTWLDTIANDIEIEVSHDMSAYLTNGNYYLLKIDDEYIFASWDDANNEFNILYRGANSDPYYLGSGNSATNHNAGAPVLILSEISLNVDYWGEDNQYGHCWVRRITLDDGSFISVGDYLNIGNEKVKVIAKETENTIQIIRHHEVSLTYNAEADNYTVTEEPFTQTYYAHTSPDMRCWDSQYNHSNPQPLPDTNSIINNGLFHKIFMSNVRSSRDQLDRYAIKILNALDQNIDGYAITLSKASVKYNSINVGDLVTVYGGEFLNIPEDEYRVSSMTYRFPSQMLQITLSQKEVRTYAAKSKFFQNIISEQKDFMTFAKSALGIPTPFNSYGGQNDPSFRGFLERVDGSSKISENFANSPSSWDYIGGSSEEYITSDSDNEAATVGFVKSAMGGTGSGGLWTDDDTNLTPFDSRNIVPSATTDNLGMPSTKWNGVYSEFVNVDNVYFSTAGDIIQLGLNKGIRYDDINNWWSWLNDGNIVATMDLDTGNLTANLGNFAAGINVNNQGIDNAKYIELPANEWIIRLNNDANTGMYYNSGSNELRFGYNGSSGAGFILNSATVFGQIGSFPTVNNVDEINFSDGTTQTTANMDSSKWESIGGGVIRPKDNNVINIGISFSGPSSTEPGSLWFNTLDDGLYVKTMSSGNINILDLGESLLEETGSSIRPINSGTNIIANGSGSDLGAPYSGDSWENLYLSDSIYLTNNYITSDSTGDNLYFYGNNGANRLLRLEPSNGAVVGKLSMTDSGGTITGYINDWRLYRGSSQKMYFSTGDVYLGDDLNMSNYEIKGIKHLSFEPTGVTYKYMMVFEPSDVSGNCGLMYTNAGDLRVIGNGAQIINIDLLTKETDFFGNLDINSHNISEVNTLSFADGTSMSTASSPDTPTQITDNGNYVKANEVTSEGTGIVLKTSNSGNDIILNPNDDIYMLNRYNRTFMWGELYMEYDDIYMKGHDIKALNTIYFDDGTSMNTAPDVSGSERIYYENNQITTNDGSYHDILIDADEPHARVTIKSDEDISLRSSESTTINANDSIDLFADDYIQLSFRDGNASLWLVMDPFYGYAVRPYPDQDIYLGTPNRNFDKGYFCDIYGTTHSSSCDVSELQFVSKNVEPGDIVEIGDWEGWEKEKFDTFFSDCKNQKCTKPKYIGLQGTWKKASKRSTKCPSIISTIPGVSMGDDEEKYKLYEQGLMNYVALSGSIPMVYIEGKFESGDILVSAGKGHAMVDNDAKWNEVVGYAKRSGKDERCEVWVR